MAPLATATTKADYTIRSLNTPDPIFVAGDSVQVRIGAGSSAAIGRAGVRLNGDDVTSAFSPSEEGAMTGTVVGLQPGINTLELFRSKRDRHHPVATLKVARAKAPALACNAASFPASALPVPNTVVTSVAPVAATATVPAHCLINGTINAGRVGNETSPGAPVARYTYADHVAGTPARRVEQQIPDAGRRRHRRQRSEHDHAAAQGYAAAANDSGHSNAVNNDPLAGGTASFGTDFLARVDFAYNAIDVTTRTAKRLVDIYYGERPAYSYFEGCSMGGREAMMVTQRFPSYFDGVVSGDPAFRITKVGVWATYTGQQLAALARTRDLISGFGVPFANNTFTNQDLQLVSNAVLKACDHLDGLVDGMVNNSQACTTRRVKPVLNALECAGDKTPACLAADQVEAILNIYSSGAPNSRGKPQYAPWMWDAGIAGCTSAVDCNTPTATNINGGWRLWNVGFFNPAFVPHVSNTPNGALSFASLGGGAIPLLFATPPILPAPTANDGLANLIMNIDFDTLAASIFGRSAAFPVSNTAPAQRRRHRSFALQAQRRQADHLAAAERRAVLPAGHGELVHRDEPRDERLRRDAGVRAAVHDARRESLRRRSRHQRRSTRSRRWSTGSRTASRRTAFSAPRRPRRRFRAARGRCAPIPSSRTTRAPATSTWQPTSNAAPTSTIITTTIITATTTMMTTTDR